SSTTRSHLSTPDPRPRRIRTWSSWSAAPRAARPANPGSGELPERSSQHLLRLQLPVAGQGPELGLEHRARLAAELFELARRAATESLDRLDRLGAPPPGRRPGAD